MQYIDRVDAACRFAYWAHSVTGCMYGEGVPYSVHCYDVAAVLHDFKADEDLICAGFLHDVLEDTGVSESTLADLFGYAVWKLVTVVTNEPGKNRAERHALTYPGIRALGARAVMLKLADRIANVEYSVEHQSKQLSMYRKEHAAFKAALYLPGEHEAMWERLGSAFAEQRVSE